MSPKAREGWFAFRNPADEAGGGSDVFVNVAYISEARFLDTGACELFTQNASWDLADQLDIRRLREVLTCGTEADSPAWAKFQTGARVALPSGRTGTVTEPPGTLLGAASVLMDDTGTEERFDARNLRSEPQGTPYDLDRPGHGHVRPASQKARCGGPAICSECLREAIAVQRTYRAVPEGETVTLPKAPIVANGEEFQARFDLYVAGRRGEVEEPR